MDHDRVYNKTFATIQTVPMTVLILYPFSCMRDMSSLRYASIGSIAVLMFITLVVIVEMPEYFKVFKDVAQYKPYYIDLNLFTGCSMVFFSYTC